MTPEELASRDARCPCPECKGKREKQEAIDAATKPLHGEIELLRLENAELSKPREPGLYWKQRVAVRQERADQAEARNKALVEALTLARDAINTLDADVFGTGSQGELEWSIRDEVIDKITVALAAHEERSRQQPQPEPQP